MLTMGDISFSQNHPAPAHGPPYPNKSGLVALVNDGGLRPAREFQRRNFQSQIRMTGTGHSEEGVVIWEARNMPSLYQPLMAGDVLNLFRGRSYQARATGN